MVIGTLPDVLENDRASSDINIPTAPTIREQINGINIRSFMSTIFNVL